MALLGEAVEHFSQVLWQLEVQRDISFHAFDFKSTNLIVKHFFQIFSIPGQKLNRILNAGTFDKFGQLLRLRIAASLADCSKLLSVFRFDPDADCFAWRFAGLAPRSWSFPAPHAAVSPTVGFLR